MESLIKNIVYDGGGTNTAAALKLANDVILNENNGMRPGTFDFFTTILFYSELLKILKEYMFH